MFHHKPSIKWGDLHLWKPQKIFVYLLSPENPRTPHGWALQPLAESFGQSLDDSTQQIQPIGLNIKCMYIYTRIYKEIITHLYQLQLI
jgi:hypothetical protein